MNQWFRMYAEFAFDPKVQVLTEALQRRYVMALCLHCNGKLENSPDDEIALSLRVTVEEWRETKEVFISRSLFGNDGLPRGWEKRQYISDIKDPTAAQRQKRYRDNKNRKRNDTVTSRLPDSDTDTEKTTTHSASEFQEIFDSGCAANPDLMSKSTAVIHQWIADGVTSVDAVPEVQRLAKKARGWDYFTGAVVDAKATRLAPMPLGNPKQKPYEKPREIRSNMKVL